MDVFHFVVVKIALINTVETRYVGVSFMFESSPVKGSRHLNREPVGFGIVNGFGDGGSVPGDFLRDTTTNCKQ